MSATQAEQRRLEDAERLTQRVGVRLQPATDEQSQQVRPEDDPEDDQPELEAAQPEEHRRLRRATSGSTAVRSCARCRTGIRPTRRDIARLTSRSHP
jgi:hypothetical protein